MSSGRRKGPSPGLLGQRLEPGASPAPRPGCPSAAASGAAPAGHFLTPGPSSLIRTRAGNRNPRTWEPPAFTAFQKISLLAF